MQRQSQRLAIALLVLLTPIAYIIFFMSTRAHNENEAGKIVSVAKEDTVPKYSNIIPIVEALSPLSSTETPPPSLVALGTYVEIVDSCGPRFNGACVYGHIYIGDELTPVMQLRTGMVLRVGTPIIIENESWYEIVFDEWLRYPDRRASKLFVRERNTKPYTEMASLVQGTTTKRIIVDRTKQILYAYEGEKLFMTATTSTGLDSTPTPRGTFTIFKKIPSRYMQGPIPDVSEKEYDLPGVPWNLYFTEDGAIIHGAYWHDSFGRQRSNGCVNLPLADAKRLYEWAEVGIKVTIHD